MIIKYITHFNNKEQSDNFVSIVEPIANVDGISIKREGINTFFFDTNKHLLPDLLVDFGSVLGMAELKAL